MTADRLSRAAVFAVVLVSGQALAQSAGSPAAATVPTPAVGAEVQEGRLAWYGRTFAGRRTASGEPYNPDAFTMAHRSLPFGTRVRVTDPASKRSVVLRVNDRGPTRPDRIADVSLAAAKRLGMIRAGVIDAQLSVLSTRASAKR